MRAALVDSSGVVANIIVLDADSEYEPPSGYTLIILEESDAPVIGGTWTGGTWVPPETPVEPEIPINPERTLEEKVADLQATVDMLLLMTLEP